MPPAKTVKRGRGRPPGATRDATRARILAAARERFGLTGYGATTNRDIATQAGLTSAALYQYFDSKLELFMATVRDAESELAPRYRAVTEGARTLREAFRALVAESVKIHEEDASITVFLSALPVEIRRYPEIAEAVADAPSEVVAVFVELVDRGVARGELSAGVSPEHVLSMFIACNMGLSLYAAAIDSRALGPTAAAFDAVLEGTLFLTPRTKKP